MSEQTEAIVPAQAAAQPRNPLTSVRQLAYASVGMWSVAAEDVGRFYQRCVVRGEQLLNAKPPAAQPAVRLPVPEGAAAPPKTAARAIRPLSVFNAFGAVESYHIDLNVEGLLPTKQDLDALSERVEALAREVDALAKQHES
jgi:polyhydroxyalkanoate synthesis regulator phasin